MWCQAIAAENNLAETAFIVSAGQGYELRWFTPAAEVPLCGHATLVTAHLLWTELGYTGEEIVFFTKSGELRVRRSGETIEMDFPSQPPREIPLEAACATALGTEPLRAFPVPDNLDMMVLEFDSAGRVAELQPGMRAVAARSARRRTGATSAISSAAFLPPPSVSTRIR